MSTNFTNSRRFVFSLNDPELRELDFLVAKAPLPDISMAAANQSYRNAKIVIAGSRIEYNDITLELIVDEDAANYKALVDWMVYNSTNDDTKFIDGTLMVVNSSYKPVREIVFKEMMPTSVSGIPFDTQTTDTDGILMSVTFTYNYFEVI